MVILNPARDVTRKISSHKALGRSQSDLLPHFFPEGLHVAGVLLSIQVDKRTLNDIKRRLNNHTTTLVTMVTPLHPQLTFPYNHPQIHNSIKGLGLCF